RERDIGTLALISAPSNLVMTACSGVETSIVLSPASGLINPLCFHRLSFSLHLPLSLPCRNGFRDTKNAKQEEKRMNSWDGFQDSNLLGTVPSPNNGQNKSRPLCV